MIAGKVLRGHTDSVNCLTVWNGYLYSGSYDGNILVWNEDDECTKVLKGHIEAVWCLTFWKNNLYSGSLDGTIRVWNEDGECTKVIEAYDGSVKCLTVWNHLYSGNDNDNIHVCKNL